MNGAVDAITAKKNSSSAPQTQPGRVMDTASCAAAGTAGVGEWEGVVAVFRGRGMPAVI